MNKLYVEIEKEIKIPEIKERLIKMSQEFDKGKSATYRLNIENPDLFFSEYITAENRNRRNLLSPVTGYARRKLHTEIALATKKSSWQ